MIAPSFVERLKSTFDSVDTNGSGQIEAEELCAILKKFFKGAAVDMVHDQVTKLINTYDKNQNGVLEFVGNTLASPCLVC